jgi:hypothetical protein
MLLGNCYFSPREESLYIYIAEAALEAALPAAAAAEAALEAAA